MDITTTFRFTASDGQTALHGEFDFRPKGFMKAVFPVMRPVIRRDLAKQSQRFKALCESS
jgi:hypothetical protein